MATKPQINSFFATPVCVHYLPIANEANAELRPIILEKVQGIAAAADRQGWRSGPDFESWGGAHVQTLARVMRDLADSLTATRAGVRVNLEWKTQALAAVRQQGEHQSLVARPGSFWSGIYYVDDGYAKVDDETLGGECELADPRGPMAAMAAPQLGFRIPNGLTTGLSETIRPQSGMIILHPSWLPRGERKHEGTAPRITIEFELSVP